MKEKLKYLLVLAVMASSILIAPQTTTAGVTAIPSEPSVMVQPQASPWEVLPYASYSWIDIDDQDTVGQYDGVGAGLALRYYLNDASAVELAGTWYDHHSFDGQMGFDVDVNYLHALWGWDNVTTYALVGLGTGYTDQWKYFVRAGLGVELAVSDNVAVFLDSSYAAEFGWDETRLQTRAGVTISF